jgi:hypothetical protein
MAQVSLLAGTSVVICSEPQIPDQELSQVIGVWL